MNDHDHEFPDELISAYLDGELSPADKVRVEEQLMDSVEHRRLFEELKALRRSLQALPAASLGEDFAARVLRRAERELLAEVPPAEKSTPQEPIADLPVSLPTPAARADHGARRGLLWSIAATAAAVGLVVFGPLFNENTRNVSQRDPVQPRVEQPEMRAAPGEEPRAADDVDVAKNALEQQGASFRAPADDERQAESKTLRAKEESLADSPQRDASPAALAERKQNFKVAEDRGAKNGYADLRPNARGGALPGANAQAKDEAAQAPQRPRAEKEKSAADKIARSDGALGKVNEAIDGLHDSRFGGAAPLAAKAGQNNLQHAAASPAMALVILDMTPAALADKFFDKVLQRHDIAVELASAKRFDQADALAADPADELSVQGSRASTAENRSESGDAELLEKAKGLHADVDVMYVEASPQQIDSLLRDLQSQSGEVLAMAYDGGAWGAALDSAEVARLAQRSREARQLHDMAETETLKLAEQNAALEADALDGAAKPQTTAPAEGEIAAAPAPADVKTDADRGPGDGQAASKARDAFARRLSIPPRQMAQVEQQLRRASDVAGPPAALGAASGGASARPTTADDSPTADDAGEGSVVEGASPAEPAPAAASDDTVADAAPSAAPLDSVDLAESEGVPLADDTRESAKLKKSQGRVRVLFVLRAVAPKASPVEATEGPPASTEVEPAP